MSKARVVVHEDLSAEQAERAVLTLLAMGVDAEAHRSPEPFRPATWQVWVAEDQVHDALPVLAEGFEADIIAPARPRRSLLLAEAGAGIWTWRNAAGSLVIALLCISIHLRVHGGAGPSPHSAMLAAGAVAPHLVWNGDWWRLLSAVFLHFDVKHLVSNMSALLVLGPPLAAAIGHVRWMALYLATGVLGNLTSQLIGNEGSIKAGASGAICGLLGALAGVAIATMASAEDARERRPAWQTLGALAALYGMIVGFEPGRDHYAHLGGLFSGVVLGRVFGLGAGRNPS